MVIERQQSAELSVLGSMLIDPRCCGLVFEKLRAENFSDPTFRNIFSTTRRLFLEGKTIDPVVVCHELGGEAYMGVMADILRLTPTAANVEAYAEVVMSQARLNQLRRFGMELVEAVDYEEGLKVLSRAEGLLTQSPSRKASTYTEMIGEYLDRQNSSEPPDYIDWGIAPLNRLKASPGHFIVLAADSSVGKTAFALQLSVNIARSGKRVGFFSYETSRMDAIDRILANTARVSLPKSKDRRLNNKDFAAVMAEGAASERVPLTLIESGEYTIDELRAETLAGRYDVIFIDYLQLIPFDSRKTRADEVAAISRTLRTMAQRLGITVFALSQVTLPEKDIKGKRRRITWDDVAESKQIKKDANIVLTLDYEEPMKRFGPRVLTVDKNKEGSLGQIRFGFDAEHMYFYLLKQNDQPQNDPKGKPDYIPGQQFVELSEAETGKLPF